MLLAGGAVPLLEAINQPLSAGMGSVWLPGAEYLTSGTSRGFVVPPLDVVTTFLPSREEGARLGAKNAPKKNPNQLV